MIRYGPWEAYRRPCNIVTWFDFWTFSWFLIWYLEKCWTTLQIIEKSSIHLSDHCIFYSASYSSPPTLYFNLTITFIQYLCFPTTFCTIFYHTTFHFITLYTYTFPHITFLSSNIPRLQDGSTRPHNILLIVFCGGFVWFLPPETLQAYQCTCESFPLIHISEPCTDVNHGLWHLGCD